MKEFDGLQFELLEERDVDMLTPIMERAFDEDTRLHLNESKGGPPGFSKRNHNFYVNKCGFHIVKIDNPTDKYECNYIMEKRVNG